MKKFIFIMTIVLSICQPITAEANNLKLEITVNGLVCDFCARAVEKVFKKEYELKDIQIDLSKRLIVVVLPGDTEIEDKKIERLIAESGYAFVGVKRSETN